MAPEGILFRHSGLIMLTSLLKKIDAFSSESINFSRIFSALKVKRFQSYFAIFFHGFFLANSENTTNPNLGRKC
jgi:hypothetical protein